VAISDQDGNLGTALEPITTALAADGYQLTAVIRGASVAIRIEAGPAACPDCLVPKSLMEGMIGRALSAAGASVSGIDLRYPTD
jgi:hypothetical protein